MIRAISSANTTRKLIYNESVILIDKKDRIEFEFSHSGQNIKFIFRFDDNGDPFKSTLNPSDGNTFDVTLHKWYSSTFVESNSPWNLSINGVSFGVLFRVWASERASQRVFHVTIWGNEG